MLRYSNVDVQTRRSVPRGIRAGRRKRLMRRWFETTRDGSRALRIAVGELDGRGAGSCKGTVALTDEPPRVRLSIVSFPACRRRIPANGCGPPLSACAQIERRRGAGGVGHASRVGRCVRSRFVGARRRRPVAHRHDRDQAAARGRGAEVRLLCAPARRNVLTSGFRRSHREGGRDSMPTIKRSVPVRARRRRSGPFVAACGGRRHTDRADTTDQAGSCADLASLDLNRHAH